MKRLWRACLVLVAAVCIWPGGMSPAEAAPQVIEATGVYIMGDNDSPKIARDAARQEAMRAAVEKAGVYVESYSRTKNMQLTEDDVKMISGAVLKVIKEDSVPELSGKTWKYTVNLTAEVDTDNIDFKAGTLKVCKQLQKRRLADGGATLAPTKNGKSRTLKPAPFVMGLLDRQYREQAAQRLRAGDLWQGWQTAEERKTALVFTTPDGKSISQTSLRYHFKKVVEAIGVPSCRVHDLRHTFAVLSLQNGDDIKTVQGNLGHATAAFTLDVYGHVSEKMKEDSAARMEAYIKSL